jgi:hypothetical protein
MTFPGSLSAPATRTHQISLEALVVDLPALAGGSL